MLGLVLTNLVKAMSTNPSENSSLPPSKSTVKARRTKMSEEQMQEHLHKFLTEKTPSTEKGKEQAIALFNHLQELQGEDSFEDMTPGMIERNGYHFLMLIARLMANVELKKQGISDKNYSKKTLLQYFSNIH